MGALMALWVTGQTVNIMTLGGLPGARRVVAGPGV